MILKIKNIQKIENDSLLYDIGVENVNNFYANGILVHNCQNIWSDITLSAELLSSTWEVSVKLDGSSMTVYHNNGEFGVCSRNLELKETEENTFWKVARKLELEERLKSLGKNIALQGELIGEGIQKNPEKLKGHDFYLFDIYLIDEGRYMTSEERTSALFQLNAHQEVEIQHVPIIGFFNDIGQFGELDNFMNHCDNMNNGKSLNADEREGVVFKATKLNNLNEIYSFKVISNSYLLNHD